MVISYNLNLTYIFIILVKKQNKKYVHYNNYIVAKICKNIKIVINTKSFNIIINLKHWYENLIC